MRCSPLLETLIFVQLIGSVLSLPFRSQRSLEQVQLLRRVPYSVVAVDGGAAATSSTSSPPITVTYTTSATETVDKATALSAHSTSYAIPTSVAPSTRTVSELASTTTIASTITRDHTVTLSATTQSNTSPSCETTLTFTSPTVAIATSSTIPQTSETSMATQTSTMTTVSYGIPPMPTIQSHGAGASPTAARSWNSTTTNMYGPTGTAWSTVQILASSWTRMP